MSIALGGHRGYGCTDHEFFAFRELTNLPVENTRASLSRAFQAGADYVEFDAVTSADGVAFVLHNVVPTDHFFGAHKPPRLLNKMAWADIQPFRCGRHANGEVATLADVLGDLKDLAPRATPWTVDIELKGVQGSGQPCDAEALVETVARTVAEVGISPARVLFSSFALTSITAMARRFSDAHYAMLFSPRPHPHPIYTDRWDDPACTYLPFTGEAIAQTLSLWARDVGTSARLGYVHGEAAAIGPEHIAAAARHGVGINSWGLFEALDDARAALYRRLVAECAAQGVGYTIMTDYLPEMRALFSSDADPAPTNAPHAIL
jgi:glycerophosphoryl diester phosphodiesterase